MSYLDAAKYRTTILSALSTDAGSTLVPMRIQMQPIFTDQSKALMVQSRGENATQRKGKRMPS
jgi:hypothetical protein